MNEQMNRWMDGRKGGERKEGKKGGECKNGWVGDGWVMDGRMGAWAAACGPAGGRGSVLCGSCFAL